MKAHMKCQAAPEGVLIAIQRVGRLALFRLGFRDIQTQVNFPCGLLPTTFTKHAG